MFIYLCTTTVVDRGVVTRNHEVFEWRLKNVSVQVNIYNYIPTVATVVGLVIRLVRVL